MIRYFLCLFMMLAWGQVRSQVIAESATKVTYRQPDTIEVVIPKKPARTIVAYASLAPVWDLAGGTAVGVPGNIAVDVLPEKMRKLPVVGTATMPNIEKVVALKPDLVLLSAKFQRHRMLADLLRKSGISAVCVEYDNYTDFNSLLDLFCRINGKRIKNVPEAEKVTKRVADICSKAAKLPKVRYAIIFASAAGFSLESSATNSGLMAAMLGGTNILKDQTRRRCRFSFEQLLLENPDVILINTMGKSKGLVKKFQKDFISKPAWKELSAAKNNRVHFLPVKFFLYRPGPRYPEAFLYLAKLLYPDKEF